MDRPKLVKVVVKEEHLDRAIEDTLLSKESGDNNPCRHCVLYWAAKEAYPNVQEVSYDSLLVYDEPHHYTCTEWILNDDKQQVECYNLTRSFDNGLYDHLRKKMPLEFDFELSVEEEYCAE